MEEETEKRIEKDYDDLIRKAKENTAMKMEDEDDKTYDTRIERLGPEAVEKVMEGIRERKTHSEIAKQLNEEYEPEKKITTNNVFYVKQKYGKKSRELQLKKEEENASIIEKTNKINRELEETLEEITEQVNKVKESDADNVTKANTVMNVLKQRISTVKTLMNLHGMNKSQAKNTENVQVNIINDVSKEKQELREEILRGDFKEAEGEVVENEKTDK